MVGIAGSTVRWDGVTGIAIDATNLAISSVISILIEPAIASISAGIGVVRIIHIRSNIGTMKRL